MTLLRSIAFVLLLSAGVPALALAEEAPAASPSAPAAAGNEGAVASPSADAPAPAAPTGSKPMSLAEMIAVVIALLFIAVVVFFVYRINK